MHPGNPNLVFGYGNGTVDPERETALREIAERHGATFVAVNMPTGPRYWFETPRNPLGDTVIAKAVLDDVKRELGGVQPPIVTGEAEIGTRT